MKRILFLLLAFVFNLSIAQEVCGTPHSVNPELEKMIAKRMMAQRQNDTKSLCVNIHFKIVRPSNATGNTPPAYLDAIIEKLNEYYNPHKISFGSIGYEYIDNSKYFTIENDKEAKELGNSKNKSNAINYYIVERLWDTDSGTVTGMAMGIPSNALVIGKSYILDATSPHEVGHCLGLYHTFQKWSHCNETASNCTTCGDKVCDTPKEMYGASNNPNLFNIMTYSSFRNHFTQGQATRMRSVLQEAPVLQDIKDKFCFHKLTGENIICDGDTETYILKNDKNSPVTWEVDGGYIVSQNNNAITISGSSNGYIGKPINIKAKVNGYELTKELWVGKPNVEVSLGFSYKIAHATIVSADGSSLDLQGVDGSNITWYKDGRIIHTDVGYHFQHFIDEYSTQPYELGVNISNKCGDIFRTTYFDPCQEFYNIGTIGGDMYEIMEHPCNNSGGSSGGFYGPMPYTINSILDTDKKSSLTIQISNATGQVVLTTQNKKFSLAHFLPGTYYARIIKNGKIVHTQTLLKR